MCRIRRRRTVKEDKTGKAVRMPGTPEDITLLKQANERVAVLARLYAALSACNAAVLRCTDVDSMVRDMCSIVVNHGGMRLAWIGLVDDATRLVRVAAAHGAGTEYLDGIRISTRADEDSGRGATGTAIREGHAVWIENFRDDPRTLPWRERAAHYGWVASAALPIRRGGRFVGALMLYAGESGLFTSETRDLFEEIAATIGFALDKLDSEAAARQVQANLIESEQHYRGLLDQTVTAIYVTQGGRIVFANPRFCEVMGYPLEEVLGRGSMELFGTEQRAEIEHARGVVRAGQSVQLVLRVRRRTGESIDLGVHGSPGHWNGAPAMIMMAQDITERRRAEERIAEYVRQLERVMYGTLQAVARMVELRDPYTAGHQRRVALVAVALAQELGWSAERCHTLELAGMVHDIGKVAIPAELLAKPSRLSNLEYEIIKTHAEGGYQILKDIDFPQPIAEIIREHHERNDGTGYPQGLKGDRILPEAKVLAVADVLESMASHRPYRPALGPEQALAELEAHKDTHYDAEIVDAAVRLIREKGYSIPD